MTYEPLANFSHAGFLGAHNAYNFGAVDIILQQLYPDYDRQILQQIEPVAHRLQNIPLSNGMNIIDDSVSSSAHALGAALDAMEPPITLIAG